MKNNKLKFKIFIDNYVGTTLYLILKPLIIFIGVSMKRNHDVKPRGDIAIVKLLGGGSLLLAYPMLLSIKAQNPSFKFKLITTKAVLPFAESISLFDQIIVINVNSYFEMFSHAIKMRKYKIDTVIDLEIYSRMTCLIGLFTMARNRIGFFYENLFWKKGIYTHLLYFNRSAPVYNAYDTIADFFGCNIISFDDAKVTFNQLLLKTNTSVYDFDLAIGPCCSELGQERMLNIEHWSQYLKISTINFKSIAILGGASDRVYCQNLLNELIKIFPNVKIENFAGILDLKQSIQLIAQVNLFLGVDSSLLHYAHLLDKENISFWGPTDPFTRIRLSSKNKYLYEKIICSPCIHNTESPPCSGNNVCIKNLFNTKKEKPNLLVWPEGHI